MTEQSTAEASRSISGPTQKHEVTALPLRGLVTDYISLLDDRLSWTSENLERVKGALVTAADLFEKDEKFAQLGQAVFNQAMRVAALERRKERNSLPVEKRRVAKVAYGREIKKLGEMCGQAVESVIEKEDAVTEKPTKEKMAKAMVEIVRIAVEQEKEKGKAVGELPSPKSIISSAVSLLKKEEGKWERGVVIGTAVSVGILILGALLIFGKVPELPRGKENIIPYTYVDSEGKVHHEELDIYDQIEGDVGGFVDSLEYFRTRPDAEIDQEKDEQFQIFQAQYGLTPKDYYHWRDDPSQSRRQIEDWVKREKINKEKLRRVITPDQRKDWGKE